MFATPTRPTIGPDNRFESGYPGPQTEEERRALDLVMRRYQPRSSSRAMLERRWEYNIAYTIGQQWDQWDTSRWGLVHRPKSSRWKVRETRNKCRPWVERTVSVLTDWDPRWKGRPKTGDIEDEQSSRVAEKVVNHYWDHLRMDEIKDRLAHWMSVTGTGILKHHWNPYAGEQFVGPAVEVGENGAVQLAKDENGQPYEESYYEGDYETYVVSPFSVHFDMHATREEEIEWVLEVNRRPLTWVDRYFPEKSEFVQSDFGAQDPVQRQRIVNQRSGYVSGLAEAEAPDEWVTVIEYYEKPSPKFPRGQYYVVANNVVLKVGDNPTAKHGLPYTFFRKTLVPDSAWGDTELTDLRTPQKNYNRMVSKKLEHIYLFGTNAKILQPSSAGIPKSSWVANVGEIITYSGPVAPSYLAPPALPSDTDREMNRFNSDFDDIGSTYGPERGQYQGKMSGTAINLLVEQGLKSRHPVIRRIRAGFIRWAKNLLEEVQENASEEKVGRIRGKNGQYEIFSFMGSDLKGNTDITIEPESMVPRSRTITIQEVGQYFQMGLYNPMDAEDKARAFKAIGLEEPDSLVNDKDIHRKVAQMEDHLALQGQPIPEPQWYEDADVHIAQHRATLNSDEFKELPPEQQAILLEHVNQTLKINYPQPGVMLPPDQQAQMTASGDGGGGEVQ